jgi:hypothetical protein
MEVTSPSALRTGLRESIPLLTLSAVLFSASVVVWWIRPQDGPALFPLWALLLVLGLTAGIGAVFSWFLAGNDSRETRPVVSIEPSPSPSPASQSKGMGRPPPDAHSSRRTTTLPPVEPWDEGPVEPRAPPNRSLSRFSSDPDPELAMDELEGIQQEMVARRKRGDSRS